MIKSSPFSFVRFEHPLPVDDTLDIPYSLPAFGDHNVSFHFLVDDDRALNLPIKIGIADTAGNFVRAFSPASYAITLSFRYRLTGLLSTANFQLFSITVGLVTKTYGSINTTPAGFQQIMEDDFGIEMNGEAFVLDSNLTVTVVAFRSGTIPMFPGSQTPFWNEGYISIAQSPMIETACFTYALLNDDNSLIAYSNQFKPVDEEVFTSVFTYGSDDDAFGFVYVEENSQNWFAKRANIVRLPVYLLKPDWPAKRTVNKQSNGRTQLLSATIEKQYAIETEQMPEVFHECLRATLLHDYVLINCTNIREVNVEVIESDNYTVAWNDDYKLPYAPGKGTLKVASFGYSNSNC